MLIENGHDLHTLVHGYFLVNDPGWGYPGVRSLPKGQHRIGPLVAVVLDDELRCTLIEELEPHFSDDFRRVANRLVDRVINYRGRYVVLAHIGDGAGAEKAPDDQPWARSLHRLRIELAEHGAIVLRHVIYGDGVFVDGWHGFHGGDATPDVTVAVATDEERFRRRLAQEESDARHRLERIPVPEPPVYTPPPPLSDEGTELTDALSEEEFRALTWKVWPLSRFLQLKGLKGHGRKVELIERVADHLAGRDTSAWLIAPKKGPRFVDDEEVPA